MEAMLMKYRGRNGEYLVMDTASNTLLLDSHAVRAICARNFGVGSRGVLVGSASDSRYEMKWFDPQGNASVLDEDARCVAERCRKDCKGAEGSMTGVRQGPTVGDGCAGMPYMTGKIFLTEKFITGNHLRMA